MTAKWDRSVAGFPKPGASTQICDHTADNTDGVDSAWTDNALATDPASGESWGSAQVGAKWLDIGVDGTELNPVFKRWERLTGGGIYGWRTLCLRYVKWLTAPVTVTLSPGGPYTADQAYTDLDMTTLLDGAGVQDNDDKVVVGVWLRVMVVDTGTLGTGASNEVWFAVRKKGETVEQKLRCLVSDVVNEATLRVGLDASEIFQWSVQVANTSPSMTVTVELIGFEELL